LLSAWSLHARRHIPEAIGDGYMARADATPTNADRKFLKRAMSAPLLEREHELDLARRWRDNHDQRALHELCTAYMRLVVAIAARFRNYGLPMSDLVQEGNVGLMLAASRFEPERELRFSTYATWWIRSCVQDYILRNWSIVRSRHDGRPQIPVLQSPPSPAPGCRIPSDGGLSPENRTARGARPARRGTRSRSHGLAPRSFGSFAERADRRRGRRRMAGHSAGCRRVTGRRHHDRSRQRAARAPGSAEALSRLSDREKLIIDERRLVEDGVTLESLGQKLGVSKSASARSNIRGAAETPQLPHPHGGLTRKKQG